MPTSFDVLLKNWLTKISNSIKGISVSGDTLTVTKTDNSTEDVTLGLQALEKKIFAQSTWYKRPELPTPNKTTITIPAGTQVAINGTLYVSTTPQELRLNTVINAETRKGKDMYIYACVPDSGTEPKFAISLNATVPTGYTADVSRKIGGFHCLCADVGTIADHPLSGYVAGDILPASVWDLLHRAESENEGMVFVNGKWFDIYLPHNGAGGLYFSIYNTTVKFLQPGEVYAEVAAKSNKELISRSEFIFFAQGSNENTVIAGASETPHPDKTGGHVDTNGRRMISNFGIEDCCGFYWQWTRDIWGASNWHYQANFFGQGMLPRGTNDTQTPASEGVSAERGSHLLNSYEWQDDGRGVYNVTEDNAVSTSVDVHGKAYGALVRALVGGTYTQHLKPERNGIRAVHLGFCSSLYAYYVSSRLCSKARVVNL